MFGLGFAIEGFSFFLEAIFIGIYIYGWNRLSPRAHFAERDPDRDHRPSRLDDGDRRQRLDEPPDRVQLVAGRAVDVHPLDALFVNSYFWHELVHMYLAGYMVTGFLVAGAYAFGRLRGQWGRYERTALAVPLAFATLASTAQVFVGDWDGRAVAETSRPSSRRSRASGRRRAARRSTSSAGTATARSIRDPDPEAALRARVPRPERESAGARHRARATTSRR